MNTPITEDQIRAALRQVKFPGYSRDIVSFGLLKNIAITGNNDVTITMHIITRDDSAPVQIRKDAAASLAAIPGIGRVDIQLTTEHPPQAPPVAGAGSSPAAAPRLAGIKHIVAVGSGKGGVGKSTVAVNLAGALTQLGRRVGLLDADIYGPSIPKMLGTLERPTISDEKLDPVEISGLKIMSMALLLENDQPVVWRGPMIHKAVQEFTHAVNWGALDILLVDLPPGTGDVQLSLAQTIALDGGVVVTTPQDVALEVARRGIAMFEKVNVKLLGIIENMSYYVCPHCGQHDDVFGHGGGRREAARLHAPFLGEIPLFTDIRVCGDKGKPVVFAEPQSPPAQAYRRCAESLLNQLA
jgi:ATP-binding protein involved in chromosome partitioning